MTETSHIAGIVVQALPEHAAQVAARIAVRHGAEVHAVDGGKIVVVLEADSERGLAQDMDELRAEPHVLLVNLVYHEMETA